MESRSFSFSFFSLLFACIFLVLFFFTIRFIFRRFLLLKNSSCVEGNVILGVTPFYFTSNNDANYKIEVQYIVDEKKYIKKSYVKPASLLDISESPYLDITYQTGNPQNAVIGRLDSFYNVFLFINSFFVAFLLIFFMFSCFYSG